MNIGKDEVKNVIRFFPLFTFVASNTFQVFLIIKNGLAGIIPKILSLGTYSYMLIFLYLAVQLIFLTFSLNVALGQE